MGRTTRVNKEDYRYLLGFRGVTESNWSWETAVLYSKAQANDVTSGRVSFPKFLASVNDSSANAFNIFDPDPTTNNSESIFQDVSRNDTSFLSSFDYKISNPEVLNYQQVQLECWLVLNIEKNLMLMIEILYWMELLDYQEQV